MRTIKRTTYFLPGQEDLELWIAEAREQGDTKTAEELEKIRDQQRDAGQYT